MKALFKGSIFVAFLFISFSQCNVILNENNTLNPMLVSKINEIGNELFDKTGIYVALAVGDKTSFEEIKKKQDELNKPYVLLALSKSSHKVDILASKETLTFFDKDEVLNTFIIPILGSPKGKDIYNASMLNGYAEIADQIASYFNIKLESSIGSANRDTLNLMRILIYGFICFAILFYVQRKIKRKKSAKQK